MIEFHPKARHCTCISSTYEAKIEVLCEFEANLGYRVRSYFETKPNENKVYVPGSFSATVRVAVSVHPLLPHGTEGSSSGSQTWW